MQNIHTPIQMDTFEKESFILKKIQGHSLLSVCLEFPNFLFSTIYVI